MCKCKISIVLLFCLMCITCNAQVLSGYVKTIGRVGEDGKVIPGQRLSGVVINIIGANPVITKEDGSFSLFIPALHDGDSFRILSIRKEGYELLDKDVIGRSLVFSSHVPIYITMVDSRQLEADKRRIEDNARRVAEKNYQKKKAIIEEENNNNNLSAEKFQKELENLQEKYEKYLSLIGDMSDQYARTDYDNLDSIHVEINICIENGELEKADSLTHTVFNPEKVVERNRAAKKETEDRIKFAQTLIDKVKIYKEAIFRDIEYAKQIANLSESLAKEYMFQGEREKALHYIQKSLEIKKIINDELDDMERDIYICIDNGELERAYSLIQVLFAPNNEVLTQQEKDAENLYQLYKNSLAKIDYDKAYYYLKMRAELDSTNVSWQIDAGNFVVENVMDQTAKDRAMTYFQRAINTLSANKKSFSKEDVARTYHGIGNLLYEQRNYRPALDRYKEAYELYPENSLGFAQCVERIAIVYNSMKRYEESERFHRLAIESYSKLYGQTHKTIAECYNNLGLVYKYLGDDNHSEESYSKAESCFTKALEIWTVPKEQTYSLKIANCYINLGGICDRKEMYSKAIDYYQRSIEAYREVYAEKAEDQLVVGGIYNNMGTTYYNMSDYINSINSYAKAIMVMRKTREGNHPDISTVRENINILLDKMLQ